MQLAYEFRHLENKSSAEARALQEKINTYSNPRNVFEQELSREEFDQYLQAYGGRSEFQVGDVLTSTPAFEAGLQPGDKIISYNNKRVFHMGDLRQQIYQVKPGETVAVEIQREGGSGREIIYLPSGPLGIRG
jgi:S1-C subfamily serine protease